MLVGCISATQNTIELAWVVLLYFKAFYIERRIHLGQVALLASATAAVARGAGQKTPSKGLEGNAFSQNSYVAVAVLDGDAM